MRVSAFGGTSKTLSGVEVRTHELFVSSLGLAGDQQFHPLPRFGDELLGGVRLLGDLAQHPAEGEFLPANLNLTVKHQAALFPLSRPKQRAGVEV